MTFHRARRSNREMTSELLEIPGVGEKTAKKLLAHFGSLSKLRELAVEELRQVVTPTQAERICTHLAARQRDMI